MNAKTKVLVKSSFIGYLIFLLFPITLSLLAMVEGVGVYIIFIIGLDALLILPVILYFKKKDGARVLLGIYSVVLFIIFSFLPVVQHKVDLTIKFYLIYGSILFLFAYIFYIMLIYKDSKNYFIKNG